MTKYSDDQARADAQWKAKLEKIKEGKAVYVVPEGQTGVVKYATKDISKGSSGKDSKGRPTTNKRGEQIIYYEPTEQEIQRATSDSERKILYGGGDSKQAEYERALKQERDLTQMRLQKSLQAQAEQLKKSGASKKDLEKAQKSTISEFQSSFQRTSEDIYSVFSGGKPQTTAGIKYFSQATPFKETTQSTKGVNLSKDIINNPDYVASIEVDGGAGVVYLEPMSRNVTVTEQPKKSFLQKFTDLNIKPVQDKVKTGLNKPFPSRFVEGVLSKGSEIIGKTDFKDLSSVRQSGLEAGFETAKGVKFVGEQVTQVGTLGNLAGARKVAQVPLGQLSVGEAVKDKDVQKLGVTAGVVGGFALASAISVPSTVAKVTYSIGQTSKTLKVVDKVPLLSTIPAKIGLTAYSGVMTSKNIKNLIERPTALNIGLTALSAGFLSTQSVDLSKSLIAKTKVLTASSDYIINTDLKARAKTSSIGESTSTKSVSVFKEKGIGKVKGQDYEKLTDITVTREAVKYKDVQDFLQIIKGKESLKVGKTSILQEVKGNEVFVDILVKGKVIKQFSYPLETNKVKTFLDVKQKDITTQKVEFTPTPSFIKQQTGRASKTSSSLFKSDVAYYDKSMKAGDFKALQYSKQVRAGDTSIFKTETSRIAKLEELKVLRSGGETKSFYQYELDKAGNIKAVFKSGQTDIYSISPSKIKQELPLKEISFKPSGVEVLTRTPPRIEQFTESYFKGETATKAYETSILSSKVRKVQDSAKRFLSDKAGSITIRQAPETKLKYDFSYETIISPTQTNIPQTFYDFKIVNEPTRSKIQAIPLLTSELNKQVIGDLVVSRRDLSFKPISVVEQQTAKEVISKTGFRLSGEMAGFSPVEDVTIPIQQTTQRTRQKSIQDVQNDLKQEQETVFVPIQPPQQRTRNVIPPQPPPPPPFTPMMFSPFVNIQRKQTARSVLFDVLVREKGKFRRVNFQPLSLKQSLNLGSVKVDTSSSASFKVAQFGQVTAYKVPESQRFNNDFKFYKRDDDVFIEKKKYRIDSLGERMQITQKGILTNRFLSNKKIKGFKL